MANLSDEQEEQLIHILHTLLSEACFFSIERTSEATNVKWSDVIDIALEATDWDHLARVLNEADYLEALQEAQDILDDNQAE